MMKTALRTLLAVAAGLALAFALVIAVELFSAVVHPVPPGFAGTMDEMRDQVSNRYELSWQGAVDPFRQSLIGSGVQICEPERTDSTKVMVVVPGGWNTSTFFQLARGVGVWVWSQGGAPDEDGGRADDDLWLRSVRQPAHRTAASSGRAHHLWH